MTMIVTVTINPLLERKMSFEHIMFNADNRNGKEELTAGGKGINVSRQLNYLNTDNIALTFLGGTNGKILNQILNEEKIKHVSIHTLAETRDASVIIDKSTNNVTTFFCSNSIINSNEVKEFLYKLEKIIENCEIVIFSGSSPCEETDIIFPIGIETANKFDKISICDTYGRHLAKCIEKSPTIMHNNKLEIESSLGIALDSEEKEYEFLNNLYNYGIKQSFITDGGNYIFAANFDYHYKVKPPKIKTINPTGSGDAFVAGIIYSWHNSLTFENGLSFAASLGALNASKLAVCNVQFKEVLALQKQVKTFSVGKKMKTLDVTPR